MSPTDSAGDLVKAQPCHTDRPLLEVHELSVEFPTNGVPVPVIRDVSLDIMPSESVGLVGESGSGKSVTALTIAGLIGEKGGRLASGSILFDGERLDKLTETRLRQIRGDRIGMIFQQPIRSLNPAFTVGDQIAETLRRHRGLGRRAAWQRAVALLDRVRIPKAAARANDYPHMLSGGMCQRVMIAAAIACEPALLIADEPTTALDVTVQSKILELLRELRDELGMALLFISHDLAVVSEVCDRIIVMYAGEIVESNNAAALFSMQRHPYTAALLASIPGEQRVHRLPMINGSIPPAGAVISGCRFHPRCMKSVAGLCDVADNPLLRENGASVRCLRAREGTSGVHTA